MPKEERHELKTIQIRAHCDCGGELNFFATVGERWPTNKRYTHKCMTCGRAQNLEQVYPVTEYELVPITPKPAEASMKVWVLHLTDSVMRRDYDISLGFVMVAANEEEARKMACVAAGYPEGAAWLDPNKTSCEAVVPGHMARILLHSFRAG